MNTIHPMKGRAFRASNGKNNLIIGCASRAVRVKLTHDILRETADTVSVTTWTWKPQAKSQASRRIRRKRRQLGGVSFLERVPTYSTLGIYASGDFVEAITKLGYKEMQPAVSNPVNTSDSRTGSSSESIRLSVGPASWPFPLSLWFSVGLAGLFPLSFGSNASNSSLIQTLINKRTAH